MDSERALRGSCQCGRNQYIIRVPANASRDAQILFDTNTAHRIASAAPLSAFIRVPLTWYSSESFPFFPDETRPAIRRIYSHPSEQHAIRQFCGFCGTPISYFTEQPRSESSFIRLTLGSLLTEDLHDLEAMGLIQDDDEEGTTDDPMDPLPSSSTASAAQQLIGRDFTNIPWFNGLIQGSRLGNMHTSRCGRESRAGTVRVEWEITEWTGDEDEDEDEETSKSSATGKRKRGETEQDNNAAAQSSTH
ncbi:hypothetical protein BJ170DRAFT_393806 [Xylariales sp. AK1849]|nr:hypothetical protein BJ170DRAFT_393806 [Xylariales sp. AK1849]